MKKKIKIPKRAAILEPQRTCGECGRGEWNTENLNYKRCPFLIYCKYSQYAHSKGGIGVCFDSTPACDHFEAGTKKGGRL